jgi:small-conductance mechanosensitive channel
MESNYKDEKKNWLREKFSNLSILLGLLLVLIAFVLLGFGLNIFGFSSDALLSLVSAIIGGLIATSSQAWISTQDRHHQLRLAAIEKRLEAHQQAFSLWRKLLANIGNQNALNETIM